MAQETTQVTKKEMSAEELDDFLGTPGPTAESIMTPEDGDKANVFTRKNVDLKYLDENDVEAPATAKKPFTEGDDDEGGATDVNKVTKPKAETTDDQDNEDIDEILKQTDGEENDDTPATTDMVSTLKGLIKKGKLIPFDDDKPIEKYTSKDVEELIEANWNDKENKLRKQVPVDFFESLPDELKAAAKYAADGGTDMKGLFQALGQAQTVLEMDPIDPKNHEQIVRQFLTTTGFGNEEEIEEEIAGLKDREELEKKAGQFKPKLDRMQESIINQKLAAQEERRNSQAKAAAAYTNSIYKTLEPGELNGVKLDRKTQELIYSGLIQSRYPSISGKQTNLLGHLLEKYQHVEPRHDIIAEVVWHLADPDGFKAKIMAKGKNLQTEKTVRMLKTEESSRTPGSTIVEKEETKQRRIPKTSPNFFKR